MLSWLQIGYGAALSAILAAGVLTWVAKGHRLRAALGAAGSAGLGAFLWNAILHAVDGEEFFVDAPVAVMPASWQDTGSGVFAITTATLVLAALLPAVSSRRLAVYATLTGLVAFLVDVYFY